MQPKAKEPKTPPKTEAALFVPDPALDALFRQTHAAARDYRVTERPAAIEEALCERAPRDPVGCESVQMLEGFKHSLAAETVQRPVQKFLDGDE